MVDPLGRPHTHTGGERSGPPTSSKRAPRRGDPLGRPHPEGTGDPHPPGGYADSEKTNRKHPLSRLSSCDTRIHQSGTVWSTHWVALTTSGRRHRGHPPGGERSGPPTSSKRAPRRGDPLGRPHPEDTGDTHPPGGYADSEKTNRKHPLSRQDKSGTPTRRRTIGAPHILETRPA